LSYLHVPPELALCEMIQAGTLYRFCWHKIAPVCAIFVLGLTYYKMKFLSRVIFCFSRKIFWVAVICNLLQKLYFFI